MSLAARCPACGTVFRVVQDQLRVSEGWVRCGRCTEVFNAVANMVELEADLPAPARVTMRRTQTAPERPALHGADSGRPAPSPAPASPAAIDPEPADQSSAPAASAPPQHEPEPEPEPKLLRPAVDATTSAAGESPHSPTTYAAAGPSAEPERREALASSAPLFVRRADRAAFWRRPAVRAGLAVLALVAALTLALQMALSYRDSAAARWPALRPALEALCVRAGCRVEAPRSIESLAVESSGLVRIEGTAMYRLSLVLANRSALALAVPSLDLTLTDTRGDVIARRALTPGELGITAASLPGRSQQSVQAVLEVADRPVSGYTIEIFYP